MTKQQIGVVGMAVMGRNIALNIESRGYSVALYNRTGSKTTEVIEANPSKNLKATYSIEEFVNSLEVPRKIMLMVQAGKGTDLTIEALLPHLDKGDILIDGGNTFFKDTIRRSEKLAELGINFIGTGVSGGEEGALKGPSIMPGGQKDAYELVAPIFEKIAAKAEEDGEPCVTYIGLDGAGHYVKMVHNGIEYGDMQLIAESYDLLHRVLGFSAAEIAEIFGEWNKGELDSFLMEISTQILATNDPETGKPMVEVIMDKAGNKGTGKWTSQSALDLGEPLSLITESVFARFISTQKEQRVAASQIIPSVEPMAIPEADKAAWVEAIREALYFSKIMSYAQGFAQLKAASDEYNWNLPYGNIARIFRAGCIIRAKFLQKITDAYEKNPNLENLMLDDYFLEIVSKNSSAVRRVVTLAIQAGIPVPTFSSALAYYDSYRSAVLPANLIQAQRDLFGAHTYNRVDKPGTFHFHWNSRQEEQLED
ncbi:NADP-dependent phosphogluconate dehydrogenase [Aerococcaceae bacterium NML201209]|nr:NADP-dependent phosphogluconate dehydrogenase [Aerococcaceae bacterium NML201209]